MICGLVFERMLGGILKMVRLGEWNLRFVSHKVYAMHVIHVNCEIGEPHV